MKTTKKALSVLLAVIMIMSSMSVCFGSISFVSALSDETVISELADALKANDTVKNLSKYWSVANTNNGKTGKNLEYYNTVTITLPTYSMYADMVTVMKKLDAAVRATEKYTKYGQFNDTGSQSQCSNAGEIADEISSALIDSIDMGQAEYTAHNVKAFFDRVFSMTNVTTHDNNKSKEANVPAYVHDTTIIKTDDYKGYLAVVGKESAVPSTIELGLKYYMRMGRYSYKTGGIFGFGATQHYHHAFKKNEQDMQLTYAENNNTTVKPKLNEYVNYVNSVKDTTFDELLAKVKAGTMNAFLKEISDKKDAITTYVGGASTYNKLFADYIPAMDELVTSANTAIEFQNYTPIVDLYKAFIAANPAYGQFSWGEGGGANNWGAFGEKGSATHAKMEADYLTFKGYYDSIVAGGNKVLDYFVANGDLDMQYLYNFTDNYKVYYLNDSRNAADVFYDTYKDIFKDYTTEEQTVLYSQVTGFVDAIPTYRSNVRGGELQVINAIYNEGYVYLLDLQEDLKVEINPYVLYFAENAHKSYADLKTAAVWEKIAEADTNRAGLTAFYNTLTSSRRDQLLGSIRTSADEMIAGLYKLLGDRFTAEVEDAYAVYTEMGKPKELDVEKFLKLNAVLVAIEADILSSLDGRGQGGYISAETRAKYEEMKVDIIPVCDAFRTTYGFTKYEQYEMTYEDRKPYENDEVKVGYDPVTEAEMNNLIVALDKILTSDLIGDLLGGLLGTAEGEEFGLGTMLSDLLKGLLFKDGTINAMVQMLYPLVATKFDDVWVGLPQSITYSGIDVVVNYAKKLQNVFDETGLMAYPQLMAKTLSSSKYAENITMLTSAKNNWESAFICNEDGTLKLTWGVDAYRESLEADGEFSAEDSAKFDAFFYQAFEDAFTGLYPLLAALVKNEAWEPVKVEELAKGTATILGTPINLSVALQLGATANSGYANLIIPIFETLGLRAGDFETVSNVEKSNSIGFIFESILDPLFTFLETDLNDKPIDTILGILPNVIYALAFNMVPSLLNMLKTTVTYSATANLVGEVMADGVSIIVGDMLITDDEGALLPRSMFNGGLKTILANFGIDIPEIDQAKLATMGALDTFTSSRKEFNYTPKSSDQAYTITADKADVGYYLLSYILGAVKDEAAFTALLGTFMTQKDADGNPVLDAAGNKIPDEEALAGVKKVVYETLNLDEMDVGDAIAAIVELANQVEYPVDGYYWYDGSKSTPIGTTSATEIYLNPGNDWTEDKAEYLYNNLEALLTSILTMAKLDLDKSTEEVDGSIEGALEEAIGGLFSNKTVTALAKLLGGLDLNALLAGDVEEGEEAAAPAIDINKIIKDELGIDLSVYAQYKDLAEDEEIDFGVTDADSFVAALTDLLAPLKPLLDFILAGKDLTLIDSAITLHGYKGYDNAIIPLLEALGATPVAYTDGADTLALTLSGLVGVINKLTTNDPAVEKDGAIYTIIDILPGVLYYISSNALSQGIDKLLTPVYAILDTIRPIYNLKLNDLLAGIEIGEEGAKKPLGLDIKNITWSFIFGLLKNLLGLDLSALAQVIYDVAKDIGVEYDSVSTLESTWKKGAYNDNFSQADMLTVVLSFVLEWITIPENGAKLDEMLGTDGIVASIGKVFEDVEITYGTPNWMYWFDSEEAFNAYLESGAGLPNTLASLEYPDGNDWDLDTAKYFAENIDVLVDKIIAMINEGKTDDEGNALPTTLAALLNGLVNDNLGEYFTDETINTLIGYISGVLANVDDVLLNVGYELINVNLVGLKNYTCDKEITTLDGFLAELGYVLDTYAQGLLDLLFFGDDIRLAKKPGTNGPVDTIVINGGFGYEKGLAIILEALGCDVPVAAEATATNVLEALTDRVDEILKNPVNEILDLLPNLVYALNADAAGVAVNNLLKPVNALLDKINGLGLLEDAIDLNALLTIKVKDENGNEVEKAILQNLQLANVVEIVEGATGLPLDAAADILVNFCTGKITEGKFGYKMAAAREDVITILLVVALELISDDAFAAKLDEMLDTDIVTGIKGILEGATVTYKYPDWNYMDGIENGDVIEYVNAITSYPNDWTEEKAEYLAEKLPALVDTVIKMVEINGVKYDSLAALLQANVNIFTTETLNSLLDLIKNLLGDIDAELLEVGFILDVNLPGLMAYEVPAGITTVDAFASELANVLNTYAKGVVEWLLLGRDFKLLVKDADGIGDELVANGSYITVNGAQGYAEGLALLLEAIGCKNLPEVYDENGEVKAIDTAATVKAVLTSLATRINEILANPVEEVLDLLPNLIYFLDADGVDAVITNTTAALMALVDKLSVFGIELDINSLVDLPKLMGIEDKYAEGEEKIGLDNLTLVALLKAVSLMTGLDLTELQNVLVPFALGEAVKYDSVSASDAYKMVYKTDLDKHDMLSVIVTAALRMFFAGTETSDKNAAKLDEMLGTDIISALKDVFASVEILYTAPDWNYADADNGTVDAMKYAITYPNNWNEETAEYVTDVLLSDDFDKLIAGLIEDGKYESLSDLLKAKVNVFTTENLQAIVDLIADLLKDIDDGLLEAAGVLLGADVVGLKAYKAPADITTVDAFAKELAKVLNTYAKGVVEWLLLGNDYTFFVKEVDENGLPVDFITLNGAKGYEAGLVLLLEALGCENLPALYDENGEALELDTAETVEAVLTSLAARIDAILSDPIEEVIALLPNLFYFLNTNGVAAVIKNTTAALTALSKKINVLAPDVNLDVASMVDLKELLKLPEDAALSMENLSMTAVLEAVGMLVGLDLTKVEDVLVGFALGEYDSAYKSESKLVGTPKKMIYTDKLDEAKMVTVVANLVLLTLADEANAEFVKGLVGEDVYKVILNVLQIKEAELKKMSWQHTDKVGESFNAMTSSENYKGYGYGPRYTEEMADYIAENIGEFVDNIIYLLGIEIEGESVESLEEILKNLVNGNLYNSANIVAIRDALAGLLDKIAGLEVNSVVVGGYIVDVLKTSLGVDVTAVAKVEVPEFTEDKAQFITYLGKVVDPLGPILNWILTDKDIAFFAKEGEDGKPTAFIKLPGNAGYKNGIVLLLEALGCKDIEAPAKLEGASGSAIVTDIAEPLLNRLDEIINNPAEELLAVLPNLIYFINSNGVDVVVKNTLNAVYTILNAIEPIAKIDLYELIGLDLETLTFEKLIDMLLKNLEIAGFKFTEIPMDTFVELTVGKLETYDSLSAEDPAYRMVYDENSASEGDMVTVLLRLVITFILTENNREVLINLLKSELGMSADAEKYVAALFKALADCTIGNQLGMDSALATIYYVYYGLDKGVGETADGKRDLDKAWQAKLKELGYSDNKDEQSVGNLITDILDIVFNDQGNVPDDGGNDVLDKDGLASNGFISFFQRIKIFFEEIAAFFRELFSFGK